MIRRPQVRKIFRMRHMTRTILFITLIMLCWINIPAQAFLLPDDQNLWLVMSQQFMLPADLQHDDVQKQIDLDLRHPKYIQRLVQNARPYIYYVYQETQKKHMPAELALLPMIESEYVPYGASRAGAAGLWQLMPGTASDYGVKINSFYDGRRSTTVSTKVALSFLSYLYQQFDHNWLLALAAYDAGPGTVMAAMHYNEEHGKPTNFWALHLPKETQVYIPKLLALAAIIQHPSEYGIRLAPVPNKAVTSTVTINKQMPLQKIATMANTSVSTVRRLNPALRRAETPPHQSVTVVLPANKKTVFENKLKVQKIISKTVATKKPIVAATAKTKSQPLSPNTYVVKSGDSLNKIAERHHTTIAHLMIENHLKTSVLQMGQHLQI